VPALSIPTRWQVVPETDVGLKGHGPKTGWHKYLIIRTINPKVSIVERGKKIPPFFPAHLFSIIRVQHNPCPGSSRTPERINQNHLCNKNKSDIIFYTRTAITSWSEGDRMKKTTGFLNLLAVIATLSIAGGAKQQVQSPSP